MCTARVFTMLGVTSASSPGVSTPALIALCHNSWQHPGRERPLVIYDDCGFYADRTNCTGHIESFVHPSLLCVLVGSVVGVPSRSWFVLVISYTDYAVLCCVPCYQWCSGRVRRGRQRRAPVFRGRNTFRPQYLTKIHLQRRRSQFQGALANVPR